jgi:hypothetical protein
MAIHIHLHSAQRQRTIDAMAKASREAKKVVKTRDCGAKPDCGCKKRQPAVDERPTRDAGEPVNAAWLKLDRLAPEELARKADTKGVKASGKTDMIMGLLRAEFSQNQIEAWSLFY